MDILERVRFEPPELGTVLALSDKIPTGATILDNSPYGNHGTITGATWVRLPSGLWVLSFDGTDDYINCGKTASLKITNTITFECWVNPTSVVGDTQYFLGRVAGSYGNSLRILPTGVLRIYHYVLVTLEAYEDTTATITNGVWTHIRYVGNGASFAIYFNDIDAGAVQIAGTHSVKWNQDGNLWVGGYDGVPTKHFKGKIALAKICPAVVSSHYQQEKHLFGV